MKVELEYGQPQLTGIPTGLEGQDSDSLRAARCKNRNPVVARYSAPVQTGPVAQPASYTIGTESFPQVKRSARGFNHPPHPAPKLKKE